MAGSGEESRYERRRHDPIDLRMRFAEDDLDAMQNTGDRMAGMLRSVILALVGATASLVVACLLLAADIARGR